MNRHLIISNNRLALLSALIITLLVAISCDESFEPREENTEYFFSMYGYLDATVDTQWIRLVPVREEFDPKPDQIEAVVTIRNIDSGEEAQMNDSLFNPNPLVVYWNYWTTMDIEPEETYEITAVRPDGQSSSTIVTIPPDFPTPIYAVLNGDEIIVVRGVDNVADVQAIYWIRDSFFNREYIFTFSHISDSLQSPFGFEDELLFRLNGNRDLELIARKFPDTEFLVLQRQLFVASAGPQWINLYELDEDIYTLADGVSNINEGVGFMLGTITKTIPWAACISEEGLFKACELEKRIR